MADCANAIPLGVEAASRLGEAMNAALAAAGTLQSTCCSPAGLLATATSLRPSSAKNRPAIFVTSLSSGSLCLVAISCNNLPVGQVPQFQLVSHLRRGECFAIRRNSHSKNRSRASFFFGRLTPRQACAVQLSIQEMPFKASHVFLPGKVF